MHKKRFLKVMLVLILSPFSAFCQSPAQAIPDFTFYKLNNAPFTDKNLTAGKKLFFVFFDSDCEHCQRAVSYISNHYRDFKTVSLYLITLDDKDKIDRFINKYGAKLKNKKNVTLLHDKNYLFIPKFKPKKYPSMFLYAPDRKLIDYEDNDESIFRISKLIKESH